MLYRVAKPGIGYLFSGSYGSRWSKTGKVWSVPRNVVYAVEGSSARPPGPSPFVPPDAPKRGAGPYPAKKFSAWLKRRDATQRRNWRHSFGDCVVESFEPGAACSFVEEPLWRFLRDHGGRRWKELQP